MHAWEGKRHRENSRAAPSQTKNAACLAPKGAQAALTWSQASPYCRVRKPMPPPVNRPPVPCSSVGEHSWGTTAGHHTAAPDRSLASLHRMPCPAEHPPPPHCPCALHVCSALRHDGRRGSPHPARRSRALLEPLLLLPPAPGTHHGRAGAPHSRLLALGLVCHL